MTQPREQIITAEDAPYYHIKFYCVAALIYAVTTL